MRFALFAVPALSARLRAALEAERDILSLLCLLLDLVVGESESESGGAGLRLGAVGVLARGKECALLAARVGAMRLMADLSGAQYLLCKLGTQYLL